MLATRLARRLQRHRRARHALPRWRRTLGVVANVALVALVAGWWTFLRPEVFGGTTSFVVVTGQSMEPTYHTGDLVVVRQHSRYDVGDVVAFPVDPGDSRSPLVIHRVIDLNDDGTLVLQGDNNDWVDPWNPAPQDVAGRPLLEARGWGTALYSLASSPVLLGALLGAFATFLAMVGPSRPRRRHDDAEEQGGDDDEADAHGAEQTSATAAGGVPATAPPSGAVARISMVWALGALLVGTLGTAVLGSSAHLAVDGGVLQHVAMPVDLTAEVGTTESQVELFSAEVGTEWEVELFSSDPVQDLGDEEEARQTAVTSVLTAPTSGSSYGFDLRPGSTDDDGAPADGDDPSDVAPGEEGAPDVDALLPGE